MRLLKPLSFTLVFSAALAFLWAGYGAWLESQCPRVALENVSATEANTRTLPFFELMSPLPALEKLEVLPKLEYKKGPPERYIERISILFSEAPNSPKERITYFGRHTEGGSILASLLFPDDNGREARFLEAGLRLSQGEDLAAPAWKVFLARPFLLREALRWLGNAERVYIMDQAGTPAFLIQDENGVGESSKDTALFFRRSSFYRVDYAADRGFALLDPLRLFRQSFLASKRGDAIDFLARHLADVKMGQQASANLSLQESAWAILLLAADVSVDPSSLDAYFHFAGLSALLYRSPAMDGSDLETFDILRNNVLAAEFYARDVAPEAAKTAAISRLARLLTRNFDQ